MTEKNNKLREGREEYLQAKQVMSTAIKEYTELYPEASELTRNKLLEQRGELKELVGHMHAFEGLSRLNFPQ